MYHRRGVSEIQMSIPRYRYVLVAMDVLLMALASYLVFSFAFKYYFTHNADLSPLEQWGKMFYLFLFNLGPVLVFSYVAQFPLLHTETVKKTYLGSKGFLTYLGFFGMQIVFSFAMELGPRHGHNIINNIWYDRDDFLVFCLIFECIKLVFFTLSRLLYFFLEERVFPLPEVDELEVKNWEAREAIGKEKEKEESQREIRKQERLKEKKRLKEITQKEIQKQKHLKK